MNENEIVMNEYHGIIVEESLTDKALLSRMKILGKRFYQKNDFTVLRVEINKDKIEEFIELVRKNLRTKPAFYAHFYRDDELIVVFPSKIFRIKPEKGTWKEAIEYGKSVGVPEEQLDFHPCRFEDETY